MRSSLPVMPNRSELIWTLRVCSASPSLRESVLEVGIIDAAVLEEAVLDVLVDRHDGFDVLQVVQALAVGHLVQSAQGDEVVDWFHGISFSCE